MLKRSKILLLLGVMSMILFPASCFGGFQWSGGNLSGTSDVFAGNVQSWEDEDPVSVDLFEEGDVLSIDVYYDMSLSSPYFSWNPTSRIIDVVLLRTIDQVGSVDLEFSADGDFTIDPTWQEDEDNPGTLDGDTDNNELSWSFSESIPGMVLAGSFTADGPIDDAELLTAVIQLDDQPIHFEIFGLPEPGEDGEPVLFDILTGDSTALDTTIDLGTVIADAEDVGYLGLFNLGMNQTPINFGESDVTGEGYYLAEKSWEEYGEPGLLSFQKDEYDGPVEITNCFDLTPGTAAAVKTKMSVGEANGSFDIVFYSNPVTTLRLTYNWAQTLVDDEGKRVGIPGGINEGDIGDDGISDVLTYEDISGDVTPGDFTFNYRPVPGDFIALASMDVGNPEYDPLYSDALPLVLQFAFPASWIDDYDEDLSDELRVEIQGLVNEGASLDEIEDALADYFSIRKEWANGDFLEIGLDHPTVDVQLLDFDPSLDEPPIVTVTVRVIIVDGGIAGDYDTVQVDGISYLLIYDGTQDGRFRDPIKLIESSDSGNGGGGGGCNVAAMTPAALLLLVPMLLSGIRK